MKDFFGGVIAGRKLDFVFEEDDGAHARIRTGDLFLTKWSLDPGEFELTLAPPSVLRPETI